MKIREAKEDDCEEIVEKLWQKLAKLHVESSDWYELQDNAVEVEFEHLKEFMQKEDSLVLVAEDGGELIAFLSASVKDRPPIYKESEIGEISNIFVSKAYRRDRLGSSLVVEAEKWFREKDIELVRTSAGEVNELAQEFWNSIGYQDHRRVKYKEIK